MYRIPASERFDFMRGRVLEELRLGRFQVSLVFDRSLVLSLECDFDHFPHTDVKHGADYALRGATLATLLGSSVTAVDRENDRSLLLAFSNGEALRVRDSNDNCESFNIVAPGRHIVV